MKRYSTLVILAVVFLMVMFSLSYAQPKPEPKVKVPAKVEPVPPPGLPPLPDLIIAGIVHIGRPSFSGENIVVPIELRIENRRGGGAAGPFQLSIMWQYPPPAAPMETELEFTGTRTFSGLEPGRGIDVRGQIIFPKSQAGHKVKIRAIVDSMSQVSESSETNNVSPWLEVQLPLEIRRPPVEMKPKGAK